VYLTSPLTDVGKLAGCHTIVFSPIPSEFREITGAGTTPPGPLIVTTAPEKSAPGHASDHRLGTRSTGQYPSFGHFVNRAAPAALKLPTTYNELAPYAS
jgi:hypothetical protein